MRSSSLKARSQPRLNPLGVNHHERVLNGAYALSLQLTRVG
jgi:hypothetical protein